MGDTFLVMKKPEVLLIRPTYVSQCIAYNNVDLNMKAITTTKHLYGLKLNVKYNENINLLGRKVIFLGNR